MTRGSVPFCSDGGAPRPALPAALGLLARREAPVQSPEPCACLFLCCPSLRSGPSAALCVAGPAGLGGSVCGDVLSVLHVPVTVLGSWCSRTVAEGTVPSWQPSAGVGLLAGRGRAPAGAPVPAAAGFCSSADRQPLARARFLGRTPPFPPAGSAAGSPGAPG